MPEPLRDPKLHLPVCTRQGEYAILCDAGAFADSAPDLIIQRKIWAVSSCLSARDDVLEAVPGMNNLLIVFRDIPHDFDACQALVHQVWQQTGTGAPESRQIVVPVVYGGESGEDLDYVAHHTGLTPQQYIALHTQATYVVYALGSQPGFAYLGGLDARLAVPRRDTPRPRVEAGAVIIGGAQAGILSRTTPSGWHIIGRTSLNCFDHTSDPPALLAPGDTVRFQVQEMPA